jgi:hypothetical protein
MQSGENPVDYNEEANALKQNILDLIKTKMFALTPDKLVELISSSTRGTVYPERDLPEQIKALFSQLISIIGQEATKEFFIAEIKPMQDKILDPKYYNFMESAAFLGAWDYYLFK